MSDASFDVRLATALHNRLTEIETNSIGTLASSLPFEKYAQACGYIEAIRQIRDTVLPEEVQNLQRS